MQLLDSDIYLLASFIDLCVFLFLMRQGRQKEEEAKEGKWKRPSIQPPPRLPHVASLEPVWPLCTSRSPDLGSSLGLHRQSTSGHRHCYYYCSCSWFRRAAPAKPQDPYLCPRVSRHCPAYCVCANTLELSSHFPRVLLGSYLSSITWCQLGITISSLRREN